MHHRILAAIALASVSTMALAQTPPAPAKNPAIAVPQTQAMPSQANPSLANPSVADKGITRADTATMAVRFVSVEPAHFMSSRLIGANVYNKQNESLGEIEDLVINDGRTISGIIVSVGGFLGVGESYVVLDPSTVVISDKDGTWRAYVDTSKDALKQAPKFTYPKKS